MDNFEEILNSLPEKPARSRLEPYAGLINELLRRSRTYREIARILAEKCQIQVSISTIHDFVRLRSRAKRNPSKRQTPGSGEKTPVSTTVHDRANTRAPAEKETSAVDEVHQRIAALKQRTEPKQTTPKQFHYDPTEPLHLPQTSVPKTTGE
jgi:IS30 family transposase